MTTIRDVAKSAGVSPITVSRVVNRLDNVNPETRTRVENAIEELGYVRNLAARSLRSRETYTLALILPDITNTFWTTVARGVEDAAQGGGYSVLLCNTDENPDKFTKYLSTVLQQRVDGVLVVPVASDALHFAQLNDMKVPTVVIDRRMADWDGDSVYCDSIAAAQALTQHLLSLGHTRIAIISGPATTSTAEDRVAGYCLALCKAGLPVDQRLIWRGEFRARSGRAMTRELLALGLDPTAIVATNNAIAAGVLEELKSHGKNVPADMAVVCFDEIPEMERFFPFLTSVTQPAYDMGINATQLLLSRIGANNPLRAREVVLPTRLILRYSCGRFL
jgi:LacI family transcriptional regulator